MIESAERGSACIHVGHVNPDDDFHKKAIERLRFYYPELRVTYTDVPGFKTKYMDFEWGLE